MRVWGRAGRGNVKSSPSRISATLSGGTASKAASTSGRLLSGSRALAGSPFMGGSFTIPSRVPLCLDGLAYFLPESGVERDPLHPYPLDSHGRARR